MGEFPDGPNIYAFVLNNPVSYIDYLGLRSKVFGAGRLCVDKNCKEKDIESLRYLTEDDSTKLLPMPKPGECVDADALYYPGGAWKIPDNGKLTVMCDKDGCLSNFGFSRWPWWLKSFPHWEPGGKKPPKWPGDIEPYPGDPPKDEPPKKN